VNHSPGYSPREIELETEKKETELKNPEAAWERRWTLVVGPEKRTQLKETSGKARRAWGKAVQSGGRRRRNTKLYGGAWFIGAGRENKKNPRRRPLGRRVRAERLVPLIRSRKGHSIGRKE